MLDWEIFGKMGIYLFEQGLTLSWLLFVCWESESACHVGRILWVSGALRMIFTAPLHDFVDKLATIRVHVLRLRFTLFVINNVFFKIPTALILSNTTSRWFGNILFILFIWIIHIWYLLFVYCIIWHSSHWISCYGLIWGLWLFKFIDSSNFLHLRLLIWFWLFLNWFLHWSCRHSRRKSNFPAATAALNRCNISWIYYLGLIGRR